VSLYRHLYPQYQMFAPALAASAFRQAMDEPGVTILAGFLGKRLVSSCMLIVIPNATWAGSPVGLIENIVTHSGHRQNGFAGEVIGCAIKLAWRLGGAKTLVLGGFNDAAMLGLCTSAGFEQTIYGFELHRDADHRKLITRHCVGDVSNVLRLFAPRSSGSGLHEAAMVAP
jgi:hypothetical protein